MHDETIIVINDGKVTPTTVSAFLVDGGLGDIRGVPKKRIGYKKPSSRMKARARSPSPKPNRNVAFSINENIADNEFAHNKSLQRVLIRDGVRVVGNQAFNGCNNLKFVQLPRTLEAIGENAFRNTALQNIYLPDSVKYLGEGAFNICMQLESIRLSRRLHAIKDDTFSYCVSLDDVTIPNTVEYIGKNAFRDCSSLSRISFPPNLRYIGKGAFLGCDSLRKVYLPPYLTVEKGIFPEHTQFAKIDDDLSEMMGEMTTRDLTEELDDMLSGMSM